jgi:hypothetical protein
MLATKNALKTCIVISLFKKWNYYAGFFIITLKLNKINIILIYIRNISKGGNIKWQKY